MVGALVAMLALASCTRADSTKVFSYGQKREVLQYSGGKLIYAGISSGKISSEDGSDGYYFVDDCTGKLEEVSGDIHMTTDADVTCATLPKIPAVEPEHAL